MQVEACHKYQDLPMGPLNSNRRGLAATALWATAALLLPVAPWPTASGEEELPSVMPSVALTLTELEQRALAVNPRLQQAAAAIGAARGQRLSAVAYPNPSLAYDAGDIGAGGTAGTHGLFVDQEVLLGPKQALANAAEQWNVNRRQVQYYGEQLRVLNDIRRRYYELLALQHRLELEHHLIEESQLLLEKAKELQEDDSDEVEEPDLLLARGSLRRRRLEGQEVQSRYQAAWEQLAALIGRPQDAPMPLEGSLEDGLEVGTDFDLAWSELSRDHPELQAARAEVASRRATVGLSRAEFRPNVTVRAGVDYDFETDETLGRVRLTVPLQVNKQVQGAVMEAEAMHREAVLEVERIEVDLRGRLSEALDRQRRYQATVAEYAREILPDARKAYEIFLERFESEETSFSRVTTAQENYVDSQSRYLHALLELRRVEVDLSTRLMRQRLTAIAVDLD